jgi:hypothetical protein
VLPAAVPQARWACRVVARDDAAHRAGAVAGGGHDVVGETTLPDHADELGGAALVGIGRLAVAAFAFVRSQLRVELYLLGHAGRLHSTLAGIRIMPSRSARRVAALIEWHIPTSSALTMRRRASSGYPNSRLVLAPFQITVAHLSIRVARQKTEPRA